MSIKEEFKSLYAVCKIDLSCVSQVTRALKPSVQQASEGLMNLGEGQIPNISLCSSDKDYCH